jgi:hypothetical protein
MVQPFPSDSGCLSSAKVGRKLNSQEELLALRHG